MVAEVSPKKLPSDECHKTLLMISQHWFRWWLGAVRQQAITWANVDPDLCCQMASLGLSELMCGLPWVNLMVAGALVPNVYAPVEVCIYVGLSTWCADVGPTMGHIRVADALVSHRCRVGNNSSDFIVLKKFTLSVPFSEIFPYNSVYLSCCKDK